MQTYTKTTPVSHVRLRMDNQTAVCYINHMGGTRSPVLSNMACQLWEWCLQRGITISAEYLPGDLNKTADGESRLIRSSGEWKLDSHIFGKVSYLFGPLQTDLFASRPNHQLPQYISWHPDPFAADAFQTRRNNLQGYAFLPFALIGRYLRKV